MFFGFIKEKSFNAILNKEKTTPKKLFSEHM